MSYGTAITLDRPYAEVVEQVRAALKEQGFGVLTEIDVQATMRALSADPSIGLLLPCNVVVRAHEGATVVEALDPNIMVEVTGDASLSLVAAEAAKKLNAALDTLASDQP